MKNMNLTEFVSLTASAEPVPGGGSIAAVSGALAAALAEMVANLTIGKKKYSDSEEAMKSVVVSASELRDKLLDDIKKDSDSYSAVMQAYKMPKNSEEEKLKRQDLIQEKLKTAAKVPMDIAQSAFKILELSEKVVEKGNPNAVTDGLISGMLARTAVLSAVLNVQINLGSIKDQDFVKEMQEKVKNIKARTVKYEETILSKSPF